MEENLNLVGKLRNERSFRSFIMRIQLGTVGTGQLKVGFYVLCTYLLKCGLIVDPHDTDFEL